MGSSRARVLIADDHVLIAEAFSALLKVDFDVVGIVHDGRALIDTAPHLQPDVVLVDIGMPLLNGLEAAQRMKRILPQVKVIYVTINNDSELVAEALLRGASGFLPKTAAARELVEAVHRVFMGELYLSSRLRAVSAKFEQPPSQDGMAMNLPLTERQVEVMQLVAEGKSMKQIASVLNLATRTVAFHKYRIMNHLQLKSDAEVTQYALQHHVVFR